MTAVQRYAGITVRTAALLCVVGFSWCIDASLVRAQDDGAMTFTVTPPLFQLNLVPGESWTSGIQVVNNNTYDITVYAEPVLFEPKGETGRPSFLHVGGGDVPGGTVDPSTFAGWMTVPQTAHRIPREQTVIIPVAIHVPHDAAPGGHYAALLIGNRPPTEGLTGGAVSVTSSIAALFFLRVAGDVIEDGRIRDFVTERSLYEDAEARLSLRFENQGNVHLQPQGDITIYNMFNKKRGYIPINQAEGYGNVLPNSIRKFTFTWKSDSGSWDIGRYRAEATLGYGLETKSFAHAATYFWVLPLMPLMQVLGAVVALVWFLGWALRAYVRRALALESNRIATMPQQPLEHDVAPETTTPVAQTDAVDTEGPTHTALHIGALMRPIEEGMVDLRRARVTVPHSAPDGESVSDTVPLHVGALVRRYRMFFIFILVCVLGALAAGAFVEDVTTNERDYSAAEERPDGNRVELRTLGGEQ